MIILASNVGKFAYVSLMMLLQEGLGTLEWWNLSASRQESKVDWAQLFLLMPPSLIMPSHKASPTMSMGTPLSLSLSLSLSPHTHMWSGSGPCETWKSWGGGAVGVSHAWHVHCDMPPWSMVNGHEAFILHAPYSLLQTYPQSLTHA